MNRQAQVYYQSGHLQNLNILMTRLDDKTRLKSFQRSRHLEMKRTPDGRQMSYLERRAI